MYEDQNAEWGYHKTVIKNLGQDSFELLYVVNEGSPQKNIVKRFVYPAYYL
jgi:hypothetical protein